jgi:hypothetical protein
MDTQRSHEKDSKPLEAKEGIVQDSEGNTLYAPESSTEQNTAWNGASQIHVFKGGWGLALLLGVGIPLFLVAGFVIFAVFAAVFMVFWILRTLFFPKSR